MSVSRLCTSAYFDSATGALTVPINGGGANGGTSNQLLNTDVSSCLSSITSVTFAAGSQVTTIGLYAFTAASSLTLTLLQLARTPNVDN